VTDWVEASNTEEEPWSFTSMRTLSEDEGVGLMVPEMV
jgi:hypothetical protein